MCIDNACVEGGDERQGGGGGGGYVGPSLSTKV